MKGLFIRYYTQRNIAKHRFSFISSPSEQKKIREIKKLFRNAKSGPILYLLIQEPDLAPKMSKFKLISHLNNPKELKLHAITYTFLIPKKLGF